MWAAELVTRPQTLLSKHSGKLTEEETQEEHHKESLRYPTVSKNKVGHLTEDFTSLE